MSPTARQLLTDFDALPENEREALVAEVLIRHPIGSGDLPDAAFAELADELFRMYDAGEEEFDDGPWTREELQAIAWERVKHEDRDEYDDLPENP